MFETFFLPFVRHLGMKLKLSNSDFSGPYPNPKWRAFYVHQLPEGAFTPLSDDKAIIRADSVQWEQPISDATLLNIRQVRYQKVRLRVGLGWAGLGWALGWAGLGWAGLGWAVLGWAGLGWAGLGWAGLG